MISILLNLLFLIIIIELLIAFKFDKKIYLQFKILKNFISFFFHKNYNSHLEKKYFDLSLSLLKVSFINFSLILFIIFVTYFLRPNMFTNILDIISSTIFIIIYFYLRKW